MNKKYSLLSERKISADYKKWPKAEGMRINACMQLIVIFQLKKYVAFKHGGA